MSTVNSTAARANAISNSSILTTLISLSPLYFLLQLRGTFGLDKLHLGLIQVLILLILNFLNPARIFFGSTSRSDTRTSTPTATPALVAVVAEKPPTKRGGIKSRKSKRVVPAVVVPIVPSLYTPALLDTTLHNFLSITVDPIHLDCLPSPVPSLKFKVPASLPLPLWTSLLHQDNLQVLQHPTTKTLYAICATFPDVVLRQLFETLTQVGNRVKWDGMASGAEEVEEVFVGGRRGSVSWLGMKGVAVIKAKDLVLLSVAGRLPTTITPDGTEGPLRLFCATTSFDHPLFPPKSDYNRMELGVSGFLAEAVEGGGSRVIQITDLSGLGSWVPSAVVRTVTQTMIPKSLVKLGRTAAAFDIATSSKYALEGDEWLPPVLGSSDDTIVDVPKAVAEEEVDEEDSEEEDGDDEEDDEEDEVITSGSLSKDLTSLLTQLRSLTSRLTQLESTSSASSSSVPGTSLSTNGNKSKSWYSSVSNSTGLDQLTVRDASIYLTAIGGAVGAATAVSLLAAWGRRKR